MLKRSSTPLLIADNKNFAAYGIVMGDTSSPPDFVHKDYRAWGAEKIVLIGTPILSLIGTDTVV
jgi:hypothetical protein